MFRGKEKNIFVFKLQSRSDVLYALSKNLWGVGPFVVVVQQYLFGVAPAAVNMDIIPMWEKLIDLPPECESGKIPFNIASSMAPCPMVEKPSRS